MGSGTSNTKPVQTETDNTTVVAAIDIGMTYSGYAYVSTSQPDCVSFGPNENRKEPSSILLNSNGEFNSFGQEAIDRFNQMGHGEGESNEFYHCYHFPKHIQMGDNNRYFVIDQLGKAILAEVVFVEALKYYIHKIETATNVQASNIRWCIVDSIKYGRNFDLVLRDAIVKAGLRKENVRMVTESLAATQYCIKQALPKGAFMVANLGGDAIHSSVYEHLPEKQGLRSFGSVRDKGNKKTAIQTNYHLDQQVMQMLGSDFQNGNINKREFLDGCLRKVKASLREMLSNFHREKNVKIKNIYLVGGLSENEYIQSMLQEAFEGINIVTVSQPGMAVLYGAILMGKKPLHVKEMSSQFSLGFSHDSAWGRDASAGNNTNQDERKAFKKFLSVGENFSCSGQYSRTVEIETVSEMSRHTSLVSEVWRSKRENPNYCHEDEKCELWLSKKIKPPADGWPERFKYKEVLTFTNDFSGKLTTEVQM